MLINCYPNSSSLSASNLAASCSAFLLINLSTEAIPNEPKVITKNPLNMYSLINNGLPIYPVTRSTTKANTIQPKDANPTTDFSLMSLLSLNNSLKNHIVFNLNC